MSRGFGAGTSVIRHPVGESYVPPAEYGRAQSDSMLSTVVRMPSASYCTGIPG